MKDKLSQDYCRRYQRHNRWYKVKARELNQWARRCYWSLARKWGSKWETALFYEREELVNKPVMSRKDSARARQINWILGEGFGHQNVWMSPEDRAIHERHSQELMSEIIAELKAEGRW